MKIAIDGPAGAGKSTIAKMIARELGFVYIDTGAMYRALTWRILRDGIDPDNSQAIYETAVSIDIHFEQLDDEQRVICNDENVTDVIRTPWVSSAVSTVAAIPLVRKIMVEKQQNMARTYNVVMDGRDIGEQVLPDADYKFFITASFEERAKRRVLELESKGFIIDEAAVKADIENRDRMDCERDIGALKILPDSIVVDTSKLSIEELLAKMLATIGEEKDAIYNIEGGS